MLDDQLVSKFLCRRIETRLRLVIVFEGSYLGEANVGSLLTEALTADVEAVLADQTGGVGADTAIQSTLPLAHLVLSSWLVDRLLLSLAGGSVAYQPRLPLP